MSEKPRRWFQIHLSTAVVLMLLMALILFLNTFWHNSFLNMKWHGSFLIDPSTGPQYAYGWPVQCFASEHRFIVILATQNGSVELHQYGGFTFDLFREWILPNIMSALGILFAIVIPLEWHLRRRDARKI